MKTALAVTYIDSFSQIKDFKSQEEIFVLGLFPDLNSLAAQIFKNVSKQFFDTKFTITSESEILAMHQAIHSSKIVCFKQFEEGISTLSDLSLLEDDSKVKLFVSGHRLPLITDFHVHVT